MRDILVFVLFHLEMDNIRMIMWTNDQIVVEIKAALWIVSADNDFNHFFTL